MVFWPGIPPRAIEFVEVGAPSHVDFNLFYSHWRSLWRLEVICYARIGCPQVPEFRQSLGFSRGSSLSRPIAGFHTLGWSDARDFRSNLRVHCVPQLGVGRDRYEGGILYFGLPRIFVLILRYLG